MDTLTFLKNVEGVSSTVYLDSLGYATIAVGLCVDAKVPGAGLRPEEIDWLTNNRLNLARQKLSQQFSWFSLLDEVRKTVVLSMYWQVGDLGKWPRFCNAMAMRDYVEASNEMLDSKVAKEEAPARWQRQAHMMISGGWA